MFDFSEFAAELRGTPLFNQTKNATMECVAERYGKRLEFFKKVRTAFDPHDRLLNQFFATFMS